MTMPFVIGQSLFSIGSGQYVSRTKRYGEIIWSGYTLWTLGCGLVLRFGRSTPKWQIVVSLIVEGAGVGFVFQPTLVAAQAHSLKRDRAVVISTRNFLRSLGGALGLAMSSAVFSNVLSSALDSLSIPLPASVKSSILESILKVPDLASLTTAQQTDVLDSYMKASKGVFYMWVPLIGTCLLLCFLIKDRGLARAEEKPALPEASGSEAGERQEGDIEKQALSQPIKE